MVQKVLRCPIIGVGRPRNQNDRQILGIGASDRIEGRKRSHAERDDGGGCAVSAGISLRAETAIELIGAIYLCHILVCQKLVQQYEVVVACNREVMLQSDLRKASCEVAADGIHRTISVSVIRVGQSSIPSR